MKKLICRQLNRKNRIHFMKLKRGRLMTKIREMKVNKKLIGVIPQET